MTELDRAAAGQQAAAAHAHDVDRRLKANVRAMRGMWVVIARDLHAFARGQLWRDLGYESFERWLADPELDLERRWTFNAIAMYEQLVVQRQVPEQRLGELQISKVSEVLPAIRRGIVTVDDALSDAETLRRVDLEARYRGRSSDGVTAGPDTSTAVYTEREPEWRVCPHCGSTYQVRPQD